MIAQKGSRNVHMVNQDQHEWLAILSCINAKGEYLPNFYVFKRRRRRTNNSLKKIGEKDAVMAMQPKAWMMNYLFMFHFFTSVSKMYDISPSNRHLLLLDNHGFHVTLEVIKMARLED